MDTDDVVNVSFLAVASTHHPSFLGGRDHADRVQCGFLDVSCPKKKRPSWSCLVASRDPSACECGTALALCRGAVRGVLSVFFLEAASFALCLDTVVGHRRVAAFDLASSTSPKRQIPCPTLVDIYSTLPFSTSFWGSAWGRSFSLAKRGYRSHCITAFLNSTLCFSYKDGSFQRS